MTYFQVRLQDFVWGMVIRFLPSAKMFTSPPLNWQGAPEVQVGAQSLCATPVAAPTIQKYVRAGGGVIFYQGSPFKLIPFLEP